MRRPASWGRDIRLALALVLALPGLYANTNTVLASKAQPSTTVEVCEFKTINYITHTLPQQCLRTAWSSPTPSAAPLSTDANAVTAATAEPSPTPNSTGSRPENGTGQEQTDPGASTASSKQEQQEEEDPDSNDIAASSFMSFEEWKEMMVRKSGQDPAENKGRKKEKDAPGTNAEPDNLGDDREIALDFDALSEKVSELTGASSGEPSPHTSGTTREEQGDVAHDEVKAQTPYRSKDAGKTCKERFSYSSFDAGATILKTNKGAKNAKAILAENKDSYMLLECRNKNKFVIVELSDDILVDTVVLANFEFFSSMIRKFRVSVSDRYPVKLDKWVDLGTFEARNSRDIQPFLVEHPQIYTKYIRIEFLSHYGNEYYCPVSLLRVHGTRMLDTWKESESNQDDEPEQIDAPVEEHQEEQEEATKASEPEQTRTQETQESVPPSAKDEHTPQPPPVVTEQGLTPWHPIFYHDKLLETCALRSPTSTGEPTPVSSGANRNSSGAASAQSSTPTVTHNALQSTGSFSSTSTPQGSVPVSSRPTNASSPASSSPTSSSSSTTSSSSSSTPATSNLAAAGSSTPKPSSARTDAADTASSSSPAPAAKATNTTTPTPPRNKTTSAKPNSASSASTPSPTVQESFFKTVTKRLQLLESNTSLSLQYIESQSRFLQEVLLTMEKKQVRRVDTFLDSLNKTVLSELRNVRTQYDQIWQSTVIALETQREQSQREIVALSSRLNVLADEVVFQKRMSILQSVLLLSCLVLVIFSRGGGGGVGGTSSFDHLLSPYNNRQRRHAREQSLASSPTPQTPVPGGDGMNQYATSPSTIASQQRQQFLHSRSRVDKALPLTPQSAASAADFSRDSTPIIRIDEVDVPFFENVNIDVDLDIDNTNPLRSSSRASAAAGAAAGAKAIPLTITEGEEVGAEEGEAGAGEEKQTRQHRMAEKNDEDDDHNDADAETSPDLDMTERETTLMMKKEEKHEGHHHLASQPDFGFPVADHDPAKPLLRHSTLSQLSGGRKPLPALPEDPS
ncbi:UNC-like C-terminal-domain-containing protein [Cercophora scortea]|uniref:UNC-like C-terminal-domain-containing protein n=1 Tax=Cercophora scortea TaxID=314031 RepID=A0AAE0MI56_9PEZI|nr:UNC-like C-terminal-domain-containing protein [Cercophora scortea]